MAAPNPAPDDESFITPIPKYSTAPMEAAAPTSPATSPPGFRATGLQDPNAGITAAQRAAAPTPTPVIASDSSTAARDTNFEQFGSGLPSGQPDEIAHYRTFLKEHTQATQLAREYAALAKEQYEGHQNRQRDIDTGAVLHGLVGVTDPDKIAEVLANNPNYDVNHVHPIIANLMDTKKAREAFASKYGLEVQKEAGKAAAAEDLQKSYGVTPTELLNPTDLGAGNMVHTTVMNKTTGQPEQKSEFVPDPKGDTYRFYNHKGEPVFMTKDTFQKLQKLHSGLAPTAAAPAHSPEFEATARGIQTASPTTAGTRAAVAQTPPATPTAVQTYFRKPVAPQMTGVNPEPGTPTG
jgi:hypothetical protein